MDVQGLLPLFLVVTFVLHGVAFAFLGWRRGKVHYFFLTGTFAFLTAIYFMRFEGWQLAVPSTDFPLTWLFRIAASLCTLIYLWLLQREEGSWLWKLTRWGRSR